jgi:hypothetical protein
MVLSDADVAAVLEIACELGLPVVDRIEAGKVTHTGPLGVRLYRTVSIEPTVLQLSVLIVIRGDAPWLESQETPVVRVGGWASCSANLREYELRRVFVDDTHVDLTLQEGVSYEVATRLVAAILHGEVLLSAEPFKDETIFSISRVAPYLTTPTGHDEAGQHDLYQVSTGGGGAGHAYIVCVEGASIVLVQTRVWIA